MVFARNSDAVDAVIEMQRQHTERTKAWPENLKMRLQVGMARGDVIEQDGDYFGDTVNIASRLSDLSGPDQILGTETVIDSLPEDSPVRFRSLGAMAIRGRSESCMVYRLEWQDEVLSDFFTVHAGLTPTPLSPAGSKAVSIELSWLDLSVTFASTQMPIHIGREADAQFVVDDPRVSRLHAKISWREGQFYLEDVSSFGTWVQFSGGGAIVALRRQECVLLSGGAIALGAPFEDFSVPTVGIRFSGK